MKTAHGIRALAVVVPVRDEEALLGRCLLGISAAVSQARAERPLVISVTIVLDSCTDGSARIASEFAFDRLSIRAGNVGIARGLGVDASLTALAQPLERIWIANTDADSFVPRDWLTTQLSLADRGCDVLLGSVKPDVADLVNEARTRAIRASSRDQVASVHGANLGVRASTYRLVGGFPPVREHEDVRLVEGARAVDAVIDTTGAIPVLTSARTTGRTPGGYAGYLRRTFASEG
jgi:hypothetical protein